MKNKPSIAIVLDKRTELVSGLYPVRLRATFQVVKGGVKKWIRKFYSTEFKMTEKTFSAVRGKSKVVAHEDIRISLQEIEAHARRICRDNDILNPEIFDRLYTGQSGRTVQSVFTRYIKELREFGQVGTASGYLTAIGSFMEFADGDFTFQEVTSDWLRRYDKWMKTRPIYKMVGKEKVLVSPGASITTIAIYLRYLRKIYNDAIAAKLISADYYPFGRRQFVIQSVQNPKQALSEDQKNLVLAYRKDEYQEAVDFWILSYLCNGMNFSDIARMRFRDIQDGMIYMDRGKTIKTARVLKKIEIPVRNEVSTIIAKYGRKSLNPADYVFSILEAGMTAQQQKYRIQDFIDRTNKQLRKVAVDLKFTFKFTTYTARHTFANISLQKGASKAFIQEALGHQLIKTTENYVAGFDQETKRKMTAKL